MQDGCTGYTLTQGQSCQIGVIFTPATAATHTATINITDNATGSPQKFPVSGTGVAPPASTVSLVASPLSGAYGSLFTLTAMVSPAASGHVTFYDGTTALGTAQVVTTASGGGIIGTATLKTILTQLNTNSLAAKYVGAEAASTSPAATVDVTGDYPTTTTFSAAGSTGIYTFTAKVIGAGPSDPSGSVTFTDNTTGLVPGTAAINPASLTQSFVAAAPVTGLTGPQVEAFADLNGDGIPDLVTGTIAGLFVQLGNGDGTFQAPVMISDAGVSSANFFGTTTSNIVFGDFNGDGKVDIAFVACNSSSNPCSVGIILGNGDGTFQKERYYDQASVITGIAVGDFNGDGILDIVAANFYGQTVDLLLGNGDGTFQEPLSTEISVNTGSVAVADLNGDGKLDVVATDYYGSQVIVLLGKGNGTFQTPKPYAEGSSYASDVTVADLRGVGKLDVVTMDSTNGVYVLLGNGDGTFQTAANVFTLPSSDVPGGMAVADINGDGKPDLVVSDETAGQLYVSLGNGDGTFQAPASYPTGTTPVGRLEFRRPARYCSDE
jgi:hypothetical protein